MRKLLLTILATAVLAGCSKDDVIKSVPKQEITFGNVFVDNSTKADPSYTAANLEQFFVYGNVTGNKNTANIYSGAEVSNISGVWKCGVTQYWIADCTYDFVAVSDVGYKKDGEGDELVTVTTHTTPAAVAGLPATITYDATCQKDLLYAEYKGVQTDANAVPSTGVENGVVKPIPFTFSHLLSKVKFTFTNGFPANSGVQLFVTDIKITNAAKKGTYNISNAQDSDPSTLAWGNYSYFTGTDSDCLNFGTTADMAPNASSESSTYCLLIPNTQDITISFTVNHNKGGVPTPKEITIDDVVLLPGHFYNFTAELNSGNVEGVVPIRFTITEANNGNWDNGNESPYPVGPIYNL